MLGNTEARFSDWYKRACRGDGVSNVLSA